MDVPLTAGELRAVTLPVHRWGTGYAVDEVDALLDRVAATLQSSGAPSPSAAEVADARLTVVRRRGYDQTSVDDLLDRVVDALRTREPAAPPLTATDLATWPLPGAPLLSLGYVREDVDALLRRAASALRHRGASGPGLTAGAVRAGRLPTTRRGGYSVAEVDDLLDRLATELDAGPHG